MKITQTLAIILFSATASSFSPVSFGTRNGVQKIGSITQQKHVTMPKTVLNLSENTANKDVQKFLQVDAERTKAQLADNWGWIVASGAFSMFLGAAAFFVPIFATGVAYNATVLTIGLTGLVGLLNAFKRENGHKLKSAISGVLYGGLAYYMASNPQQGLDIVTVTIAAVIAVEGFYETALAVNNKDLQGRPWHFVAGIVSVLAGIWLTSNIPVSSLFAPGAALGTRLTTNGATKVAVGLAGKELANQRKF
jgi:uncharacterized membrane protein HdeD (DUF308 family)